MERFDLAAARDRGASIFSPVAVPAISAPGFQPVLGAVLLGSWSFTETTGAVSAVVELHQGNDVTGQIIAVYDLSAGQSVYDLAPGEGIYCPIGLFVAVTAGTIRGGVTVRRA